jgi:hypothetical protein
LQANGVNATDYPFPEEDKLAKYGVNTAGF